MIDSTITMQKDEKSSTLMKAVVRERYGSPDVLQIKELVKPAPDDVRGVLVKIYASELVNVLKIEECSTRAEEKLNEPEMLLAKPLTSEPVRDSEADNVLNSEA